MPEKKKKIVRVANRQGRRKRIELLEAAGKAFSKHGYDGTTVRDIADEAKVQPSALIYHFGSKENLFQETLRYHIVENGQFEHLFDAFNNIGENPDAQQVSNAIYASLRGIFRVCHGPRGKVANLNGLIICMLNDAGSLPNKMVHKLGDDMMSKHIYKILRVLNKNISDTDLFWWSRQFWSMILYSICAQPLILAQSGEKKYSEDFVESLAFRSAKTCCLLIGLPVPEADDKWKK